MIPPASPLLDIESPSAAEKKVWTAGSVTYSQRGLNLLFLWLLWGDFAFATQERIVPPVMQILFKRYGVSDTMAGLLFITFPGFLGFLSGPIISCMSDRHRGPKGRRIPYIFFCIPIVVVSIVGLGFSPQLGALAHKVLGGGAGLNSTILMFLGVFCLVFQLASSTSNMLYGALVRDVVPQSVIGRFFGMFRVVSLVVGIIFNFWLFGEVEANYLWFFLCIALLYGGGYSLMCMKVKEGEYSPPPATLKTGWLERVASAAKMYIKTGYGNSYYRWYFVACLLCLLAFMPVNLYNVFYAKSLNVEMDVYGKYMAAAFVISLCMAYPIGFLTDRFHPLRLLIVVLVGYMGVMLWSFLCVHDARTYGIALILHSIGSGTFYTVFLAIPQKLLPRDKFAQMQSAGGTFNALFIMGAAPALGMLLDWTHHDYRYIYLVALVFSGLALALNLVLHGKFMALGGPRSYLAPE